MGHIRGIKGCSLETVGTDYGWVDIRVMCRRLACMLLGMNRSIWSANYGREVDHFYRQ